MTARLPGPWQALIGLMLWGCSNAMAQDPQTPAFSGPANQAASTVVLCPKGSSYDPERNACDAREAESSDDEDSEELAPE